MLNPFPSLLTYSTLAPFILRLVLAFIVLDLGFLKLGKEKSRWIASLQALHLKPADLWLKAMALIDIVGGIMLLVGWYTQIAALAFVIIFGIEFYVEYKDGSILRRDLTFYLLVLAIAVSLLLSGAGAFAFDIPL
jgi:uncharacterized membrane protein YphA (DoxX/SURF4 family)